MFLIAGLGNPGTKYQKTRHNIGFMAIDHFQQTIDSPNFQEDTKLKSAISKTTFDNHNLILAKPLTFMNLSGEAIQKTANFYKIKPENIIILYDDIDLPFAKIRIRANGGSGTHNGMRSIKQHIGSNFPRIRIGIESRGSTSPQQIPLDKFVLSNFNQEEEPQLQKLTNTTTKIIHTIITQGVAKAMNHYN